jgi:uncharacterized protein YjbI with pentapeptide repeats
VTPQDLPPDGAGAADGGRGAALHRLLSESTPDQRALHLLRLVEEAADACLRLPELDGARLPLHDLRLDAEALRHHAEGAAAPPPWWHGGEGRVRLRGADLRNANLQNAVLTEVDLTGADFGNAVMRSAVLNGARLEDARFARADLTACSFLRVHASQADFRDALLEDARFDDAVLRFSHFEAALLEAADLSRADLRNADLKNADLSGARLAGAKLQGADLANADLEGADLRDTELVQVNLLRCNLRHVRLAGAWMERTRLRIDQLDGALGEEVAGEWAAARQGYLDLEQNFRGLGDAEAASWCYRRARRMGKRDAWRHAVACWRARDWRGVLRRGAAAVSDGFVEWLCDYGESLPRVLRAYILVLLAFTALYGISGSLLHPVPGPDGGAWLPTRNPFDLLEFSFLDMTTSGTPDLGLKPASRVVYFVGSLQYMTGVLLIGLFGFVLGNRIRR